MELDEIRAEVWRLNAKARTLGYHVYLSSSIKAPTQRSKKCLTKLAVRAQEKVCVVEELLCRSRGVPRMSLLSDGS